MLYKMTHCGRIQLDILSFPNIIDIRAHADPNLGMMNEIKVLTKMIKNLQIEMANQVISMNFDLASIE